MNEKISGNLIIIGGAEDKRGKKEILKKVAEYINTKEDKMLIATIATEYPEKTYDDYKNIFIKLGIKNIDKLDISKRVFYRRGSIKNNKYDRWYSYL